MRRAHVIAALALVAAVAACKSPQATEVTVAATIAGINDQAALAVEYGILSPDDGEAILALTRTATLELTRSVAARRAGEPREVWQRAVDVALDALAQAQRILNGRGK